MALDWIAGNIQLTKFLQLGRSESSLKSASPTNYYTFIWESRRVYLALEIVRELDFES